MYFCILGLGKNFNDENSCEFVVPPPNTNSHKLLLLKFFPFPYTITAISWPPIWISHLWIFGAAPFFYSWAVLD